MRGLRLLGGTFVGEGALLRFYVLHCVALAAGDRVPDGGALLARAQGRRYLGASSRERIPKGQTAGDPSTGLGAGTCGMVADGHETWMR